MPATTPARATARIFGFPVQVRPGFVMFMILIVFVNGSKLGVWMAGGIAVFTLAHELGHAFAARATGAEAEISLDFLAGYASYAPTRPLARWERAGIAFAGPATQLVLGCAVLAAMGVNPLDQSSVRESYASLALWWSGPVLALMNLLPLMPLDGGNIAAAGLDVLAPGRGHRLMTVASLPITIGLMVGFALNDDLRLLAPFLAFLLVFQLQAMSADKAEARGAGAQESAQHLEDEAWRTGHFDTMAANTHPSPWFTARTLLAEGRSDDARAVLVRDLTMPNGMSGTWFPPHAATPRDLEPLVALLPRPLPSGNVYAETVLVEILVRLGTYDEAARYGAESFARTPSSTMAVHVSRSAAALGEPELAVRWLRAGALGGSPMSIVRAIDVSPELGGVRWRADVQSVRADAAAAAAAAAAN